MRYTAETGPRPPTDGDRLRSNFALARVAPKTGTLTGEVDQYGLLRFERRNSWVDSNIAGINPGINPSGKGVLSSFWVPALAGQQFQEVTVTRYNGEPVLGFGEGSFARVLNPLEMTHDPETQILLVNVHVSGIQRVDREGILRDPDGCLPRLTLKQHKLLSVAMYGRQGPNFLNDFYLPNIRGGQGLPNNIGSMSIEKKVVQVDSGFAGSDVYLVVPYVPGRSDLRSVRLADAVVFSDSDQSKPIEREIVTKRIPLSSYMAEKQAYVQKL